MKWGQKFEIATVINWRSRTLKKENKYQLLEYGLPGSNTICTTNTMQWR